MSHPSFGVDHLRSGFSIFIRHPHAYTDADLLARFQLGSYRRSFAVVRYDRYAALSDDGVWTRLADDWCYTLWNMGTAQQVIEDIARQHDVFACSEGDCDRSFDYVYFRDGQLVRRYSVSSPDYSERIIVDNVGVLLPGEAALLKDDGDWIGLALAETLGIKSRVAMSDVRFYCPAA